LTVPLKFLFYVRDVAVMTPRGLIVANLGSRNRAFETDLFRFALRWSPALQPYRIAFDAHKERLYLQGGDVIVADERTLLVGVGNLTEDSAARLLAQKLRMDVISVQMPGGARFKKEGPFAHWNGLRLKFLHLDTIFNLTGPRSAVAVPYFLEAAHAGSDPLTRVLLGAADQREVDGPSMEHLAASLAQVGNVKRYKAHTGELDPAVQGLKLVDYLRTLGYEITYIGGDPPEGDAAKHVVESVLRELRFQGGNVVALGPKRLVACEGNAQTLAALRRDGCEALTFPADELVRWHGGAHCMTLPLERGGPS
jgi:arginine deiminase